jgi:hypothetical protein
VRSCPVLLLALAFDAGRRHHRVAGGEIVLLRAVGRKIVEFDSPRQTGGVLRSSLR